MKTEQYNSFKEFCEKNKLSKAEAIEILKQKLEEIEKQGETVAA